MTVLYKYSYINLLFFYFIFASYPIFSSFYLLIIFDYFHKRGCLSILFKITEMEILINIMFFYYFYMFVF
jgi:hypothetical protein